MKYASIGSISSGTLQGDDLAQAFADELEYQLKRQSKRFPRRAHRALIREAYQAVEKGSDDLDDIVEELQDALNEFAPPHCYFGAHDGDPADFGFYVTSHMETEFDGLKVDDLSEVPADYRGKVLEVSDHGNMTLYIQTSRKRLVEVWSCV